MNNRITIVLTGLWLAGFLSVANAQDWLTAPSYFSHDPETGERTSQFAETPEVLFHEHPSYMKSGYHHRRSSIRVGDGTDQFHVVEEWGRPVRPYGEWERPFRPYSVPYHLWGEPYRGLGPITSPFPPMFPPAFPQPFQQPFQQPFPQPFQQPF